MNYKIIRDNSKYFISINNSIPTWQTGFNTITCAKVFADSHDLELATNDYLPYSVDDFEWIVDTYGFEYSNDRWILRENDLKLELIPQEEIMLKVTGPDYYDVVTGVSPVLIRLDQIIGDSIFANIAMFSSSVRTAIYAASARDLTKQMVRVKSSNLWSYGMNVKKAGDKVGDLVIQFKGKNGGPTGGLYMYFDVPVNLWRKFVGAPSKGHFFWLYIRNNFQYRKLDGDKKTHLKNGV